uniref:Immunoglobulin domain-containing protein n=1 Tax=Malurus cyaneus samueli TaxID=2593467 RepID=A0A8C5TYZ0_9PASS
PELNPALLIAALKPGNPNSAAFPAASTLPRRPRFLSGAVGGSLSFQCHHNPGRPYQRKYLCRWKAGSCSVLLDDQGFVLESHRGRVEMIGSDPKNGSFAVRLRRLRLEDAGWYWCGASSGDSEITAPLKLLVHTGWTLLPGTARWALSPRTAGWALSPRTAGWTVSPRAAGWTLPSRTGGWALSPRTTQPTRAAGWTLSARTGGWRVSPGAAGWALPSRAAGWAVSPRTTQPPRTAG